MFIFLCFYLGVVSKCFYLIRLLPSISNPSYEDSAIDTCISNLSSNMQSKLNDFFSILENSPEELHSFRFKEDKLSSQLVDAMETIQPIHSLNFNDLEKIKNLEKHGCSFEFLHKATESNNSITNLLEQNASLINTLVDKQKTRLDNEPKLDEHLIAHSFMNSLVQACSHTQPLELASQHAVSKTRKYLRKQIQYTLP